MAMSDLKIKFNGSPQPTLGVELELFTVNKNNYSLINGAPELLKFFKKNSYFKEEYLQCIVEIASDLCKNPQEIYNDLRPKLNDAIEYANHNNFELISMSVHPFSRAADQLVFDNARYIELLDRMQWPLRRLLITGLHVHVGVETGEKAIAVVNGMKRYIPYLIALSANSPFFEGELTGLASTRTKIFEGLPNTGVPVELKDYSEFQKFTRALISAQSIESVREIWWDIRPHPRYGTVEIRICDAIPNLHHISDLAALCQALVVGMSNHYDQGAQLPFLDNWIIYENKWRATRYGLDAQLITDEHGTQEKIKDLIKLTINKLSPEIEELKISENMDNILGRLNSNHSYYNEQISVYNKTSDFNELIKNNIEELKK
jgi:glutamate---cysteine ligase / carboxylate-amine ligase